MTGHMPILAVRPANAVLRALIGIDRTHFFHDGFKLGAILWMHGLKPALASRLLERLACEFNPVRLWLDDVHQRASRPDQTVSGPDQPPEAALVGCHFSFNLDPCPVGSITLHHQCRRVGQEGDAFLLQGRWRCTDSAVTGDGAHHLAAVGKHGCRPAGTQAILERLVPVRGPVRIATDIHGNTWLAGAYRHAAGGFIGTCVHCIERSDEI